MPRVQSIPFRLNSCWTWRATSGLEGPLVHIHPLPGEQSFPCEARPDCDEESNSLNVSALAQAGITPKIPASSITISTIRKPAFF